MIDCIKQDNRLPVTLVAFLSILVFVVIILVRYDWDPMAFVMEGTRFRQGVPDGTWGYDGQFAYYIALDPLNAPPWMDHDAYRYQRILYPALVWVFSLGGQPVLIPWVMIAINLVCILAATWLLSGMLAKRGVPAWVTLSFVFFIGVFVALRGNLLEPLAISLSLLGLAFTYRERWLWAGIAFALAVLAKEMALAFLLGVVAWLLLRQTPPSVWEKLRSLSLRVIPQFLRSSFQHDKHVIARERQAMPFIASDRSNLHPMSLQEALEMEQSLNLDMSLRGNAETEAISTSSHFEERDDRSNLHPMSLQEALEMEQSPNLDMSLRGNAKRCSLSPAISPPRHIEDRQQLEQSPPDNMSLRGAPSDALYRQRLKQSPPFTLTSLTRHYRTPILLLLGGLLPAITWGVILTLWLGHSPMSAPFAAMELIPYAALRYVNLSPAMAYIILFLALPSIILGIMGLLDIRRWSSSPEALILLANVALIALMPKLTWINIGGALRVGIGLVVASLLYIVVFRPKLMPWFAAFWLISGLIMIPSLIYGVE
jgi:hypothetical protein